jgi:hypothetical protein
VFLIGFLVCSKAGFYCYRFVFYGQNSKAIPKEELISGSFKEQQPVLSTSLFPKSIVFLFAPQAH